MYGSQRDWMFVVKCRMKASSLGFLFVILVSVLYVFSYSIYICEHASLNVFKLPPVVKDFKEALWLMCVTVTTVGYGDITPRTMLGKIVAFFACVVGILVTSLTISSITGQLNLSNSEELAYGLISKLELNRIMNLNSTSMVYYILKLRSLLKKSKDSKLVAAQETERQKQDISHMMETFRESVE